SLPPTSPGGDGRQPCSQHCYYSLNRFHFFFFNDTATTEIYTLSLHDALPISHRPTWPWWDVSSGRRPRSGGARRSEEHTSELQSLTNLVCRLLLEKKEQQKPNEFDRAILTYLGLVVRGTRSRTVSTDGWTRLIVGGRMLVRIFFFFNNAATPEISPFPLPDALRI